MEITDVNIYLVNGEKLKAYATVIFDDAFVVRDMKIIHGNNGLFVAMPNKKTKDGTFRDVAHPLNKEMRKLIEESVLNHYRSQVEM
ncbi:MAG: septation regulator SpoVG [bacterium]|nr:septation regulator SpoVG [bacterium]